MIVYHVGKTKYSNDLAGEGARLNGGRWNHISIPCIYASESRALAILEYTVNVNINEIPRSLSITSIEIPDDGIVEVKFANLPENWTQIPAPTSTKDFGTLLLSKSDKSIIKIPSIIIQREFNFILNPLHADRKKFKIRNVEDFVYDIRIKLE